MKFDFEIAGKFDVVIIGSGISGLICALELGKNHKTVCMLSKEAVTESSSQYAQGGIAVPLSELDSVEKHLNDTVTAGTTLCNIEVGKKIINYSATALEKLIYYGVKFDLDKKKNIEQTKEAAHSRARVCHVGGDASGRLITKALIDRACREANISISQGSMVLSILKNKDGNAYGVLVCDVAKNKYIILGKEIIVATGGIGQIYKDTTNPKISTGDGIAMAYHNGAKLQDVEMVQFHPTVLLGHGEPLLITEAIRGEGGRLKNTLGEYFASKYHKNAELAPRDILARAILSELEKTKSKFVILDISNFSVDYFKNRFPTIFQSCTERKIDLFNNGIPVCPASHYFIGGIKSDIFGKTSVCGLWAIGEAASNGFHGANRLASNSLLECVVLPHFLVNKILEETKEIKPLVPSDMLIEIDETNYNEDLLEETLIELQKRNSKSLGLIREGKDLKNHLDWLQEASNQFNLDLTSLNIQAQELKNMILISSLICQAALFRNHSLGVHFRKDFPEGPTDFKHTLYLPNKHLKWEFESSRKKELIPSLK